MKLPTPLLKATFIKRVTRFSAMVELDGARVPVHVPNSGRLKELFSPGRRVYLAHKPGAHRKTSHDLCLVQVGRVLVCCDARLPTFILEEALGSGRLEPFRDYPSIKREVAFGESRLDLVLLGPQGRCFIETKSVTLVPGGTALFPDAPTTRGARHLKTLMRAVEEGHRAAVVFVIQRRDALCFSPYDEADQEFASALREVVGRGVEVYAYRCRVTMTEVVLEERVPVIL